MSEPSLVGRCVLVRSSYPEFSLIDVTRETPKMIYGQVRRDGWRRDVQAKKGDVAKVDATNMDLERLASAKAECNRRRGEALTWYTKRVAEILHPTKADSESQEVR